MNLISAFCSLTTTMSSQFFGNLHSVPYNMLEPVMQMREGSVMTNVAAAQQSAGDLEAAEQRHKQALLAKQQFPGANTTSAAISHDNLGRVQLQMGKLDEAEGNFRKAIDIRKGMAHKSWDNAVTRENLAQTLEAKGDLKGAKEVRLFCGNDNVCCAHYEVRAISGFKCLGQCPLKNIIIVVSECLQIPHEAQCLQLLQGS